MGQCRHLGVLARLIGAVEIELQRVVIRQGEAALLRFWRSLLFQLQIARAHLARTILLQLVG